MALVGIFATTVQIKTISQSFDISQNQDIKLDVDGEIHYQYWSGDKVVVETTIQSELANPFALHYAIRKGHFKLEKTIKSQSVVITPRKINSILLVEGQRHTTKTSYKVLVPNKAWYDRTQKLCGK